jgi:hypothetical protein
MRDVAWAMFGCLKLVAPTIFRTIPITSADSSIRERITRLESNVCGAYAIFRTSSPGSLIEIPLAELELEHAVQAFVQKL